MTVKVFSSDKYGAQLNVVVDAEKVKIDVNVLLVRMKKDTTWVPEKKWVKHYLPQDFEAANSLFEWFRKNANSDIALEEQMLAYRGEEI